MTDGLRPQVRPGRGDPRYEPLHAASDEDLIAQLVRICGGTPEAAVLRVAMLTGVAVAWVSRDQFADVVGRELTDEEWTAVQEQGFDDFDQEMLSDDRDRAWIERKLYAAGVVVDDDPFPRGLLETDEPQPDEEPCRHRGRGLQDDGRLVCVDCGDVDVLPPGDEALLRRIHEHARANEGALAVTLSDTDVVAGYHFGREAPDSDMVGGAAYGMGPTLGAALLGVLADLGIEPPAE
jgi:hypothetical protein